MAEQSQISKEEFVVPRGNLFLQQPLQVEGLSQTYHVGEKIEITIKFDGIWYDCGYPHLSIEDDSNQEVWESGYVVYSCDPDMKKDHVIKEWNVYDTPLGIPIIDKNGFYTLSVTFGDSMIQNDFWVK